MASRRGLFGTLAGAIAGLLGVPVTGEPGHPGFYATLTPEQIAPLLPTDGTYPVRFPKDAIVYISQAHLDAVIAGRDERLAFPPRVIQGAEDYWR